MMQVTSGRGIGYSTRALESPGRTGGASIAALNGLGEIMSYRYHSKLNTVPSEHEQLRRRAVGANRGLLEARKAPSCGHNFR